MFQSARNRFAALRAFFLVTLVVLSGCAHHQAPANLQKEGELLCDAVRETWLHEPAPENILFINSPESSRQPPQLNGLLLAPTTVFDYLYVRTWLGGDAKKPERRVLAYFVIRDTTSDARIRGVVRDGLRSIQILSRYHWQGIRED